jgi:hypothetical protein
MTTVRITMLLLAGGLLWMQNTNGQSYKPGSRVEAERNGKWHKATVLSEKAGAYEVTFDDLKDDQTNKKLQSSLPAEYIRPCAGCSAADPKKPVPPRPPLKLPLLQKASDNTLTAAIAKNIIQATWEDPARYVDGDVKVINADVTVLEVGKPVKEDSAFVNDGSLLPESPIYPVTVAIKVRRYKSGRVVSSEGEYLYRLAITKTGNWAAFYVSTRTETPLETTQF